ncbi:MAG: damage-inducible protein DinB [Crocinitomicaceae bacterium]|nr:damage-inducible protein DinB [Crocinitomicaceae bacterium]|tara:strand:- start:17348 stop:17857 length:510 start_codon:yes stop_codon:yes gene_type:complete
MSVEFPKENEYLQYFQHYISLVNGDPMECLANNLKHHIDWVRQYPQDKLDSAYAPGKWTVKDVLQHIIDTERIMSYRALCIARGESQLLPSYDENEYAKVVDTSIKSLHSIMLEYQTQRESTLALFKTFTPKELTTIGKTDSAPFSPRAILYINVGHEIHHFNVLRERY